MQTILLIEDNDRIREDTAELLELAGYRVLTAENGKLGVGHALATPPDLVVCDIMMPVLDGFGVLHIFNQNATLTSLPFIFLTAKGERADLRRGMELGADDYLTKPFTETELLSAITSRLSRLHKLRAYYDLQAPGDLGEFFNRRGPRRAAGGPYHQPLPAPTPQEARSIYPRRGGRSGVFRAGWPRKNGAPHQRGQGIDYGGIWAR